MRDKYDIFEFTIGKRDSTGTKVVDVWIKLPDEGERFHLCFLTDYQLEDLMKIKEEM